MRAARLPLPGTILRDGGITTQAHSFAELSDAINEAVRCHFGDRAAPRVATLHFTRDPELQLQPA